MTTPQKSSLESTSGIFTYVASSIPFGLFGLVRFIALNFTSDLIEEAYLLLTNKESLNTKEQYFKKLIKLYANYDPDKYFDYPFTTILSFAYNYATGKTLLRALIDPSTYASGLSMVLNPRQYWKYYKDTVSYKYNQIPGINQFFGYDRNLNYELPVLWSWKHRENGVFEIVPNYQYIPDGSAITSAKVVSAYNVAASKFVSRVLAYHDRAHQRQLKNLYNEMNGSIAQKLNENFKHWDYNKRENGFVLLQSVAIHEDNRDGPNYHISGDKDFWLEEEKLFYISMYHKENSEFEPDDSAKSNLNHVTLCRSHHIADSAKDLSEATREELRGLMNDLGRPITRRRVQNTFSQGNSSSSNDQRASSQEDPQTSTGQRASSQGASSQGNSSSSNNADESLNSSSTTVSEYVPEPQTYQERREMAYQERLNSELSATKNPTLYRLVNGYLADAFEKTLFRPSQYAAMMYSEMLDGEISGELPPGTTLNIKGYLQAARDETTFKALRLDILPDIINQSIFRQSENFSEGFDFDAAAQPFELRLHAGDENMHFKFVRHFIDLVGLCLYSTAEYHGPEPHDVLDPKLDEPIIVDGQPKDQSTREFQKAQKSVQQVASEEGGFAAPRNYDWPDYTSAYGQQPRWRTQSEFQKSSEPTLKLKEKNENFSTTFGCASAFVWTPVLEGEPENEIALDFVRDTTPPPIQFLEDYREYNKFRNDLKDLYQKNNSMSSCLILRSAVESADFELELPYEPFFIDMSDSEDYIVLGSTVTPFVLAIKTAELLLRKTIDVNYPYQYQKLTNGQYSVNKTPISTESDFSGASSRVDNSETCEFQVDPLQPETCEFQVDPLQPETCEFQVDEGTTLKEVLLGKDLLMTTFNNRFKGIHFSNRKSLGSGVYAVLFLDTPFGMETASLVQSNCVVHGRFAIDRKHNTFLAMLYDLIFESDESHRRLRGLIRPYVVMVKGPGSNALVTPMSFGTFAYASPEMLSIEQEAVALLSHISRDTKKRKRNPTSTSLQEQFANGKIRDFYELDQYINNIKTDERKRGTFAAASFRLIRALIAYNDIFQDSGKTQRDRVAMARFDSERFAAAHELLFFF